ncbi:restriction endonuclease subunit S [Plantactinospora sp. BB1]|uniref:restriction endonuclease subunit S n=1 Tax=Plantactinospora sp. BB1 TaxID=2071627 RepID=UPI000D161F67|nr:restriction endonuclease subunit S [Plantactinospora sp. BB1]AVT36484.1 type I restriction endonuclease subunit S [Plantactinospora sp. BB1]
MNGLPNGWATVPLGELVTINPRRFDTTPDDAEVVSVVPMASVEAETGRIDATKGAVFGDIKQRSLTPFQEGDVLFAKVTPCMENGKVAVARGLIGGRALGSTELYALRSSGAVDPEYLASFLLQPSVRKDAERHMTGAVGLRRVPRAYLESLLVPLPPLAEQRRIIDILGNHLSVLDSGVAQLSALAVRVNRFRDQVMLAASTGQLNLRSDRVTSFRPASAGVDDGELPPLPEAWKWMRLREIADVVGGITKDSKRQSDPSFVEVPYLRVANVQRAYLDLAEVAHIRVAPQKAEKLRLRYGDVLLNEGGDRDKLGRGWIWEDQVPGCIHQNHVFRARISDGVLHPKLLAWHANGFGRRWFEVNGLQSVNLASISLRKMKEFPVPVPPLVEQASLVELAEKYLSLLDGMEKAIESARRKGVGLRTALLATAFAGRLVPQDPNDEPASELLARIKVERAAVPPKQREARGRRTQKDKPAPPTRVIGRDYQQGELPL